MNMFLSLNFHRSLAWVAVSFLFSGLAHGSVIDIVKMTIADTDPTEFGRLSRSGIPSDWSVRKTFPGVIDPTTVYHYTTLDLNLPTLSAPFVDEAYIPLDIDSDSVNTFMSAYLNAYNPLNPAATYLGDNGFSGQNLGHPGRASAGTKRFMRSI